MNERLKKIIKRVILSTTASLSAAGITSPKNNEVKYSSDIRPTELTSYNFNKENDIPKLILKKPSRFGAIGNIFQHKSHSSHRSHVSHTSHVSGYTQPRDYTPPKRKDNSDDNSQQQENMQNHLIYELGSRVLQKGMQGTDVAELQNILSGKGYYVKVSGTFDSATEDAVKKFQKTNNIDISGKVDIPTLYFLRKNNK